MPSTSITSASGRDFQIKVSDPDVSPSVYNAIGGLRNTQMTINNNPVDITSVTSGGFGEFDPDGGIQNFSFSLDGIYDSATTGAQSLMQAARDRVIVEIKVESGHGDAFFSQAVVETFTREGAFDNVELFSATIQSHGRVAYIP